MPAAAVASLQDLLDQTANDPSQDPSEKIAALRALRGDLSALLGQADTYLNDQELRRESSAMGRVLGHVGVGEDADVRGELLDRGLATPEQADAAGLLSHDEIAARTTDGTLEEAIVGLARPPFDPAKHPRGRGGKFEATGRAVAEPKGRDGSVLKPPGGFASRARELDTRVADAVARGVAPEMPSVRDTGPVPEAGAAPNAAGKVSQKHLLALAKGALRQPSTVDVYAHTDEKGNRVYDRSRQALHRQIINKMLEGIPSQKRPEVMFMGGGYASGKGTVGRKLAEQGKAPKDALTLDPDKIKTMLPEFQRMLADNDPEANLAVYEEAWDIAQALQKEGQRRKVNMLVDGLGNTSAKDMLNRVASFKKAGYGKATAHYVNVPTDEAIRRADRRAQKPSRPENKRFIPEPIMRATHRDVSAALPGIMAGSKGDGKGLDEMHVYDTSGAEPKPLYSLVDGKETVHDPEGLQAALDKSKEDVAGLEGTPARADTQTALQEVERLGLNEWPKAGPEADKILGGAKDTQEKWRAPGAASPGGGAVYSAERKPLHDRIVGQALAPAAEQLLGEDHPIASKLRRGGTLSDEEKQTLRQAASDARNGEKPTALFMGGGSASGKSSALAQAPELVPDAAVHIDPDAVKEQIPEYGQMVDAGERYAAGGAHEESSDVAKRLQEEARELGLNMVVDGTGDSKAAQRDEEGNITEPGKFAKKLIDADKNGYNVNSLYVTVPTNTAVVRSVRRAQETGRFVPVPEVRTQHRNVSANFPEIGALPFVKDLKVFDTSGSEPQLIAHGGGGKVTPDDADMYQQFLDKANE